MKDAVAMETVIRLGPSYISKKHRRHTYTCTSQKNSECGCMLLHKSTISCCSLALMLNISLQSQNISSVDLNVVVNAKKKVGSTISYLKQMVLLMCKI